MNFIKTKTIAKALISLILFFVLQTAAFAAETAMPQTTTPAQTQRFQYRLLESFPGFFSKGEVVSDLPTMILAIYKFGIWTIGIAGLLMLTVGGVMYMSSAGNNASIESAKNIIKDALLGIVAALGAYLFMYVINPDLTKIDFSRLTSTTITETTVPPTAAVPDGGVCNGTSISCCSSDPEISCTSCNNCVSFTNNYSSLCYNKSKGGKSNQGCYLNSTLASGLKNINLESLGAQVSEAWPPSVHHSSSCHADGTCADVRFTGSYSVEIVTKIFNAIKSAGLSPVFEYTGDCAPYIKAGINCKKYDTQTSSASIHVNRL